MEDDKKVSRFIGNGLREEGHHVVHVDDLAAARGELANSSPDMLLVDRMLPDGDGLDLVRELRQRGVDTPAICLTARDRVDERVEGLLGGADDYLVKPFAFDELLARISALSRRSTGPTAYATNIADLTVDPIAIRAQRAGQEIRLTQLDFRLRSYLLAHRGRVVSRTQLLDRVWNMHHDPETNVVGVYINYLRNKIDRGFSPPLIHTVRGFGYVLDDKPR